MEEILSILIRRAVGIDLEDWHGEMPSTTARRKSWRIEQCRVLEYNGKQIRKILWLEGNEKLVQEDWKER